MSTEFHSSVSSHTATESNELRSRQKIKKMGLEAYVYRRFNEPLSGDPRDVGAVPLVANGFLKIVGFEGPMIAKTACDRYLRAVGIGRMGREVEEAMRRVLKWAIDSKAVQILAELPENDSLKQTIRLTGEPVLMLRTTQKTDENKRAIEEIPAGEVQLVARYLSIKEALEYRSDELLRRALDFFELTRLTPNTKQIMLSILDKDLPHVDEV